MKQGSPAFGDGGAFRAIFFEEAQEHLANTEAILLRLDTDAPSPDDLNAIFRAVHSIKGSAGMLGFSEIAALTHVLENLLDLLRKGDRAIAKADVDAMLEAGDIVKSQVDHHLGLLVAAPDSSEAVARLRERVASTGDAGQTGAGPKRRSFNVALGPLAAPIDAPELDMMLAGLGEMGSLSKQAVANQAGGLVCFEVELEGSEFDLRSVLSLVVPPEQIAIVVADGGAARQAPAQVVQSSPPAPAQDEANELFVDPVEFKRGKALLRPAETPPAAPAEVAVDLFVTPEHLVARGAPGGVAVVTPQQPVPAAAKPQQPAAKPEQPTDRRTVADRRAVADQSSGGGYGAGSLRVATEKIDLLVNLVGELVITESMLSRQGALFEQQGGQAGATGLADLARHTRDLQEMVLAIRMVPINEGFARIPRLVRELSARLGKQVELKLSGEGTELDRGLIEKLSDPLLHLVRNAVDHGLESTEARIAAGKKPIGTVGLSASQRGGKVVVEVFDDGRGLDREVILARAAERGRVLAADASDAEVWQLLFDAGFSTAQEVTDLSGRGVGMDVVRRNILSLGGTVEIASTKGQGLKVTMTVPLTLAIVEAMTVSLGSQIYVLPLAAVLESRSIDAEDLHALPGQGETLAVRGAYLPVLRLAELFPPQEPSAEGGRIAVIVEAEGRTAAVLVDALVGQQQIVVKNLETNFRKVPGASGATIMSDGSVALILDAAHLTHTCGTRQAGAMRELPGKDFNQSNTNSQRVAASAATQEH
jgi:two-component system, chemotaxis family, sensor kinase CheA